jgi:hypothetical protein
MKDVTTRVCIFVGLIAIANIALAQEAPADTAQQRAAAGDWVGAFDSYAKFLRETAVEQYRDKKDFGWILEEFEKKHGDGDYAPLKKATETSLDQHKDDPIYTWRLHRLLADIAEKAKDKDALVKELDQTIATYPKKVEGDPSRHSSLQHLYNRRAMLIAETDVDAAETYLLKNFKEDARFVYFFDSPWRELYEKRQTPQRYRDFAKKIVAAYQEKARKSPAQQQMLSKYAAQLWAQCQK